MERNFSTEAVGGFGRDTQEQDRGDSRPSGTISSTSPETQDSDVRMREEGSDSNQLQMTISSQSSQPAVSQQSV